MNSRLIVFSKHFKEQKIEDLIDLAHENGFDGYDLCVRPEYPVNPDNVTAELPRTKKLFSKAGLSIPMITGNFDLLLPDDPAAEPILAAMDETDIRFLKLGYFKFDPALQKYWDEVDRIRQAFEGWEKLGRKYNVKICYHTHSNQCMGLNCAALAHLIRGFDPEVIGAYVDPAHMAVEGEEFGVGVAMVRDYLSIVALKDVLPERVEQQGHGAIIPKWVPAGEGVVDWSAVFDELKRLEFDGPFSVHCEFRVPEEKFMSTFKREVNFFRKYLGLISKQ